MSGRGRPQRRTLGKRPARLLDDLPVREQPGTSKQRRSAPAATSDDDVSDGIWFEEETVHEGNNTDLNFDERLKLVESLASQAQQIADDRIKLLEDALLSTTKDKGQALDNLNITVSSELKLKIVQNKFVDLQVLSAKSFIDRSDEKIVSFVQDEQGRLVPRMERKERGEMTIDQWTSAFHVLMSVYLQHHPQSLQDMLSYVELIRGAARDNPGNAWRLYDQQFRSRLESDPARPWGMIDNQLWLQLFCKPMSVNVYSKSNSTGEHSTENRHANQSSSKRGVCRYFNIDSWEGFSQGFRIPYHGERKYRLANNHRSAQPKLVLQKFLEEVRLGRVAGPFLVPPISNLMVSPVGLVEKSTMGEYRLIFDLSFPKHDSVNGGIPAELCSVQYTHFDAVTEMVRKLGQGSHLVKVDIRSAFRLLPLHPEDFGLMGMSVDGKYFVDKAWPFGCSISCAYFEKFSSFLEWCVRRASMSDDVIHYLDDFCGGGETTDRAQDILDKILDTFNDLGVPVAPEKVEGPSTCLKFLGLMVDTVALEVRIPQDKLEDLKCVVSNVLGDKRKTTLRQLQSLIGKLNFACKAVVPGRAFCRRLIDATIGLTKPYHHIRVTEDMKSDLQVWSEFLETHNGNSIMLEDIWVDSSHLNLFTDAAGAIGFGAYFNGHWTYGSWPAEWRDLKSDITFKEFFPIVVAVHIWGCELQNRKVLFHCDNMAVVHIINRQSTRSTASMGLMRVLVSACLKHNILFRAKHIPGINNEVADALSRFQFRRFRALVPDADARPAEVPQVLMQQLQQK